MPPLHSPGGEELDPSELLTSLTASFARFRDHLDVLRILDGAASDWKPVLATISDFQALVESVMEGVHLTAAK